MTTTTSVADHPPRARQRHQLHRHRRRVLAGRVGGDRRQGAEGPPRRGRARDQGARPDGRRREPPGQLAALDPLRGRAEPAPPRHRLHRPLPDPPARPDGRSRGDALGAHRSPARGQGASDRQLDVPGRGDRRGAMGRRAPRLRAVPLRATAVFDPRARHRTFGAADLPALRHGRDRVEPAQRRLAHRQVQARPGLSQGHPRRRGV